MAVRLCARAMERKKVWMNKTRVRAKGYMRVGVGTCAPGRLYGLAGHSPAGDRDII